MRRATKITGIVLCVVAAILVAAILIVPPILTKGPMPEALAAVESTDTVVDGRPITFTPIEATSSGLVIYPGALVEPRSYAPVSHALANGAVFVAIVPMPLSFAILGSNRVDGVIKDHPEVTDWHVALIANDDLELVGNEPRHALTHRKANRLAVPPPRRPHRIRDRDLGFPSNRGGLLIAGRILS
jgi:hypothetical protein